MQKDRFVGIIVPGCNGFTLPETGGGEILIEGAVIDRVGIEDGDWVSRGLVVLII